MNQAISPWYKKTWGKLIITVALILLLAIISFGIYIMVLVYKINQNPEPASQTMDPELWEKVQGNESNYSIGTSTPELVIVEFSDFACPYCRQAFPTIREISLKYKDRVKIIYRDYPALTEYSVDLALAARCAGEQGLFWNMHDSLFLNQGVKEKIELMLLAGQIGADQERFEDCFDSRKYYADIAQDLTDAKMLKLAGTPTWYIGGQRLDGDIPRDTFIYLIDGIFEMYSQ